MVNKSVITKTELPLPLFIRGKVRDTYDLGSYLLIVATDRISAFDVVLPQGIPDKGKVLNMLSAFWFEKTLNLIPNHMEKPVDSIETVKKYLPGNSTLPAEMKYRSMIVRKMERINIECVARGYISGSAWSEYKQSGTVNGMKMPGGLQESQKLAEPIFTPTTKADTGHDMPLTMNETIKLIGKDLAEQVKEKTLAIYTYARDYALEKGIIIADTKVEFGLDKGQLVLIDELLTPDSSRFWEAKVYKAGQSQASYDKQPVRDWLVDAGWNKMPPAPMLPAEVVEATTRRYREAYERLTGKKLG